MSSRARVRQLGGLSGVRGGSGDTPGVWGVGWGASRRRGRRQVAAKQGPACQWRTNSQSVPSWRLGGGEGGRLGGLNSGLAWQLCAAGGGAGPRQRGLHDDPGHWSGPPLPRRWPDGLGAPLLVPGPLSQGRGDPALLWNRKVKTFASDVTKGSCSQAGGRCLRSLPWSVTGMFVSGHGPTVHRPRGPQAR